MTGFKSLLHLSLPLSLLAAKSSGHLIPQTDSETAYDYIVVGGGTCGLAVASRLSENANVTVMVIEAGESVYDDERVKALDGYGSAFETNIDWNYTKTAQTYADGKPGIIHQGKAIGGTSTINGMVYTRVDAAAIDAWEAIGNAGWNWDNLYPYYRKQESFQVPDEELKAAGMSYNPSYHGFQGPVKVGHRPLEAVDNGFSKMLQATYETVGMPIPQDVNGGELRGYTVFPEMVDEATNIRADAARSYYYPHQSRQNLALKSGTTVNKLLWKDEKDAEGNAVAEAVEIVTSNGTTSTLRANKGVIISAGVIRTPQLLELSGVGNPKILSKFNITTRIDLPGVGENLIDQNNNGLYFKISGNRTYDGGATTAAYPNVTDLFGAATSNISSQILAELPSYAEKIAAQNNNATSAEDLLSLLKVQHSLLFDSQLAAAEILQYSNGTEVGSEFWVTLPFARGNLHITSNDPAVHPAINPNHFMFEYDTISQAAVARYMRNLYSTAPLSNLVGDETWPGTAIVAADADDATWAPWLKSNYRSNFHLLSTAIMMPRKMDGVVSERLQLYGAANVRVVDASVLPFQVSGHLTSTLYAISERASDLIKEDDA